MVVSFVREVHKIPSAFARRKHARADEGNTPLTAAHLHCPSGRAVLPQAVTLSKIQAVFFASFLFSFLMHLAGSLRKGSQDGAAENPAGQQPHRVTAACHTQILQSCVPSM